MTVVALRQRAVVPRQPLQHAMTLEVLLELLGAGQVQLVAAPRGVDVELGAPLIHEATAATPLHPGDVVLAVGTDVTSAGAVDLVLRAGAARAGCVVFTATGPVREALTDAARSAGIALLTTRAGTDWGEVHALLRAAQDSLLPPSGTRDLAAGGLTLGDLTGLAQAVAAMVGGAVVIHDVGLQLLAYSTHDAELDPVRRETILRRRAPESAVQALRRTGVLQRLRSPGAVVALPRADHTDLDDRLAVGVHAGNEQLGSIWVLAPGGSGCAQVESVLQEAALIAAPHLVHHLAHEDVGRRRHSEALRQLFAERLPAAAASEALELPTTGTYVVMALQLATGSEADRMLHGGRLLSAASAYAATYRLRTAQTVEGDRCYVLVHGGELPASARRLADYLVSTAEPSCSSRLRVALSDPVTGLDQAPAARSCAEQVLRVSADLEHPLPHVVSADEVQAACILDDIRLVAQQRPRWLLTSLQELVDSDGARGTSYVPILRAYLDCGGNMRAAAGALGIHPNTYRYRLRRLTEITDWDLEDPDQRLVLALQLRLGLLPDATTTTAQG